MHKADRLFQLVNLIRVHQPITAERLAERIGVSVRSVYRYIDDLALSGVPVYGTTGVGYALDASFDMPPLRLSRVEVDALTLGMEMLSAAADHALSGAARTLLSKVAATVPEQPVEPQQPAVSAISGNASRGHLSTLRQAIEHKRVLQITYTSLDGTVSRRLIQPIGLFYWSGKWTVGSWCTTRSAYRDFRVDRIASIITSEAPWSEGPNLALRTYMRHQASAWRAESSVQG